MLNDPAYVEMALAFADRILTESESPEGRADHAFRLALARPATARELLVVGELIQNRETHYQKNKEAAEALLRNPKFVYKPKHKNRIELATWFNIATTLLNLDETVTRN